MLQLKLDDRFLDLNPDQNTEMEKNSPLFLGLDSLLAEYSTPIEIKYTDNNARAIGYLFFDLTIKAKKKFDVDIYFNGTFITRGTLVIESAGMNYRFASQSSISGYLLTGISSFFSDVRKLKLSDIEFIQNTFSSDDIWAHVGNTWNSIYQYVFVPARNQAFIEDDPQFFSSAGWQNKLDATNNIITTQPLVAWPFLSYVLNTVFTSTGWLLDTSGLNDTDWTKLLIYSNHLIQTNTYSGFGDSVTATPRTAVTIDVGLCLPQDYTITRFILEICKKYFWFPITDSGNRTVKLIALKEVNKQTPKDWTAWADNTANSDFSASDKIFAFKNNFEGEDQYPSAQDLAQYPQIGYATTFADVPDPYAITDNDTLFYVFTENKYYKLTWDVDGNKTWERFTDNIYDKDTANATDTFETAVTTLPLARAQFDNGKWGVVPIVNQAPKTKWGLRTVLYHGFAWQTESDGSLTSTAYPYASPINTPIAGSPKLGWSNVLAHTDFQFEYGIINYWAKPWLDMIQDGEIVKRNFYLPLHEIKNFQWNDIILFHNIPFFIKSYIEPLNNQGFIEATMQRIRLGATPTTLPPPPPPDCVPLATGEGDWDAFPIGTVGEFYIYYWTVPIGTTPITLTVNDVPSWMTVLIDNTLVQFMGTPTEPIENGTISITLNNDCSEIPLLLERNDFFVTEPPPCDPVSMPITAIPDGHVGVPYIFDMIINGTQPFNLTYFGIPGWMSPQIISGNILRLSGTPNGAGSNIPLDIRISNCAGTFPLDGVITIT